MDTPPRMHRLGNQSEAVEGASRFPPWEVDIGLGHPTHQQHRGHISSGWKGVVFLDLLTTEFGSVDSILNSSRYCPTAILWASSWRCLPTAASLSTPVMVNTAGYRDSRMAYPKAQCWLPRFNIYVHDLPHTLAKKYRYADDPATLLSDKR